MKTALLLLLFFSFSSVQAASDKNKDRRAEKVVQRGAKLFIDNCSLCHGFRGLGEGTIPLLIQPYPNTNLALINKAHNSADIKKVILHGAALPNINQNMPPFFGELSPEDVDNLTVFIQLIRTDLNISSRLLNNYSNQLKPSLNLGRASFQGRCSLCHGAEGLGDGRMARLIKNPSPANLTISTKNECYFRKIIKKGGKALGRSEKMPSWSHLSDVEIKSVISYIKQL